MAARCGEQSRCMKEAMTCSKWLREKVGSATSAKPELQRRVNLFLSDVLANTEAGGWKTSPKRARQWRIAKVLSLAAVSEREATQ